MLTGLTGQGPHMGRTNGPRGQGHGMGQRSRSEGHSDNGKCEGLCEKGWICTEVLSRRMGTL